MEYISLCRPERKVTCVNKTGCHGNVYVLQNEVIDRQHSWWISVRHEAGKFLRPLLFFSWFQFLNSRKPTWTLSFVIFLRHHFWRKTPRETEKSFNFNWLSFHSCACRRIETEIYWKTFHTFQFGKILGNPAATLLRRYSLNKMKTEINFRPKNRRWVWCNAFYVSFCFTFSKYDQ